MIHLPIDPTARLQLAQPIDPLLVCGVCAQLLDAADSVCCPCGAMYCRACTAADGMCPAGGESFATTNLCRIPSAVTRLIEQTHYRCPHEGCPFTAPLAEVREHAQRSCPRGNVECIECHERMRYDAFAPHWGTVCGRVQCDMCHERMTVAALRAHLHDCAATVREIRSLKRKLAAATPRTTFEYTFRKLPTLEHGITSPTILFEGVHFYIALSYTETPAPTYSLWLYAHARGPSTLVRQVKAQCLVNGRSILSGRRYNSRGLTYHDGTWQDMGWGLETYELPAPDAKGVFHLQVELIKKE